MKIIGIVGSPRKIKGNTGRKLVHDWQQRILPPDVEQRQAQFMERMRRLILYRKDEWPFEYEYWKKMRKV